MGDTGSSRVQGTRQVFRIPEAWKRVKGVSIMDYLNWFERRYGFHIPTLAAEEWTQTDMALRRLQQQRGYGPGENYILHAYKTEDKPNGIPFIDVHSTLPTDARAAGDPKRFTGLDFEVMAAMATQPTVVVAVRLAAYELSNMDRSNMDRELNFVCERGTHRSVATMVLTALLFAPDAQLTLHTRRTIQAATQVLVQV